MNTTERALLSWGLETYYTDLDIKRVINTLTSVERSNGGVTAGGSGAFLGRDEVFWN